MADSYVCSGATMRCTRGTSTAKLTVLPSRTVNLTGPPMANVSDHTPFVNLGRFGRCRSLGFPPTAAATSAHHGHLTPMPCAHNTPQPWQNGKDDYIIRGNAALLKSSTCRCFWGGTISIVDNGQNDTGPADLQHKEAEDFEREQEEREKEGLDADSVLDGIQLTLDAAGFVPGFGAIPDLANAAISALRGNWADAGLSILAAVPAVGDAAAAAKLAKKGMKAAKKAKAAKVGKTMKETGEISHEELAKHRARMAGMEYDPNNSGILYDTMEPVGKPFGSVTASGHKKVDATSSTASNRNLGKGGERSQGSIKNENETLSKFKNQQKKEKSVENPYQYQGGKGKDPSRHGDHIDYNS